MGLLTKLTEEAKVLNRELRETSRLMPGGGAGGAGAPRGASANDFRRLRGDIRQLSRQVAGMGGRGAADPFLSDLGRSAGPRSV